jgi:hypothetical protein
MGLSHHLVKNIYDTEVCIYFLFEKMERIREDGAYSRGKLTRL